MSDIRKAAQQVLEALEKPTYDGFGEWLVAMRNARDALRAALAELTDWEAVAADQALTIALLRSEQTVPSDCPDSHQPVAWMVYTLDGKSVCVTDNPADFTDQHKVLPLYTSDPIYTMLCDLKKEGSRHE